VGGVSIFPKDRIARLLFGSFTQYNWCLINNVPIHRAMAARCLYNKVEESGSQIGVLKRVPNQGPISPPKSGSHITPPNQGPKLGFHIGSQIEAPYHPPNRGPILPPKSGSQIGVPYQPDPQIGVPNRGPKFGSHIGVQYVRYINSTKPYSNGNMSNPITCILRCR
jgi:hypothetical protein